jgi:hypothetical protein
MDKDIAPLLAAGNAMLSAAAASPRRWLRKDVIGLIREHVADEAGAEADAGGPIAVPEEKLTLEILMGEKPEDEVTVGHVHVWLENNRRWSVLYDVWARLLSYDAQTGVAKYYIEM